MAHAASSADRNRIISRLTDGMKSPSIRVVDSFINTVTIINDELVLKIPRDSGSRCLGALNHESLGLRAMEGVDVAPLEVPRLVEYSKDPAYLVATYVPGKIMTANEVSKLSTSARERVGRDLGSYIVRQVKGVKGAQLPRLPESWPDVFSECFDNFSDRRYPSLTAVAAELYEKWRKRPGSSRTLRVIHGDLTAGNIVFGAGNRLKGVIDFGRLHRGEIADEVSCLPRSIDPALLPACIKELKSHGIDVDPEVVRLWWELKDLQVLPYWIKANNTRHPNFRAWREIVANRYPHLNWDELF